MTPFNEHANTWLPANEEEYFTELKTLFPQHYDKVVKQYPSDRFASPLESYQQINADICVICPTRDIASVLSLQNRDVFLYVSNHIF